MPDTALHLAGFSPDEAVWRLLQCTGYDRSRVTFSDTWPIDGSPESMLLPLESEGMLARMATIGSDDLPFMHLPALLQVADATWVLALRYRNGFITLATATGEFTTDIRTLGPCLTGQLLDITDTAPGTTSAGKRFRSLIARHTMTLVQIVVATVILQVFSLAVPEITAVAMNRALPDGARDMLHLVAAGVILVALFQASTGCIRERLILYLTTRIGLSLEQGFLHHLLRLPFPVLHQKSLGEMLQAYLGIVAADSQLIERGIAALLDGILSITYLISMGTKLMAPTLVMMGAAAAMALFSIMIGTSQANLQRRQVDAQARQHGFLAELMSGCATVKSMGAERRCMNHWVTLFRKELSLELRKERCGLWSEVGLTTLQQALSVTMLIWGGRHCLTGTLHVGTLFAFLQLGNGFTGSVFNVVNAYLLWCIIRPQLDISDAVLTAAPVPPSRRVGTASQSIRSPVIMEDVWFRYTPDMPWILKGFNLTVEPGEKYTLRGTTGSGKSTILRLLAGLHVPEKGIVTIGGLPPAVAQHHMLYLPQFTSLYAGSIIENLRILSGGASMQALTEASRATGLHDLVTTLPMQYGTILPPGGHSLSGGQRQLIIVTAALASGRAFVILDEVTSNIDTAASSRCLQLIAKAPWTVVMASHTV